MSDAPTPTGEPTTVATPSHARLLEKVQLDPVTQQPMLPDHLRGEAMHGARRNGGELVDVGRLTREQKQAISASSLRQPKPPWLKVRLPGGGEYGKVSKIVREQNLVTVCEEARCPNIGECWGKGTATFQILGDTCTRACRYCGVATGRPAEGPDPLEPGKLAHAVEQMGIRHAVITSVDRDDLDDRGAGHWATTIEVLRRRCPETTIEVLTPDFMGVEEASMRTVIAARPDVFSHNTETVRRLYRRIRPRGDFDRAMWVLRAAKELAREFGQPPMMTKTGIIAGMGETIDELKATLDEIREQGVDVVTIGQYLRPTVRHLPVDRYYTPDEFDELRDYGMAIGFGSVFAGPLVRSSYKAEEQRFAAMDPTGDATRALTSGAPQVPEAHLAQVGVVPDWKR
jgi:lipoic acid synthetase